MEQARSLARQEREHVGVEPAGLLDRLIAYLEKERAIDLIAMTPAQMQGSRAEIDGERVLRYSNALSMSERLDVFAHELGHLVMHGRLLDPEIPVDPIVASVYGDAGPASVARYSDRTREEAEARAFALEFQVPSPALFARWQRDDSASIASLAAEYGVGESVVRVQLANALHDLAIGVDRKQEVTLVDIPYSPEQIEAARCMEMPVLVDAGPGTGKTATLIRRIQFILEECGGDPSQILLLTFSNEAAEELRERTSRRFGERIVDAITISTFHGFGMQFLYLFGEHAGLSPDFLLIDEDAQVEIVSELLGTIRCPNLNPLKNPSEVAAEVVRYVNHCKNRQITPDALEREIEKWEPAGPKDDPAAGAEIAALFRAYESAKQATDRVDYADLILLPLRLLDSKVEVSNMCRDKFRWVLVDEFQDVTRATSALLRAICGPDNPPWVVGDARQSIYQFLGAARENVLDFPRDFPGARTLQLTENRRSSAPIVAAANEVASLMSTAMGITKSAPWQSASPVHALGAEPVAIAEAVSDYAEAEGVVDQIKEWLSLGVQAGEIAVLARRHIDVRNVVLGLTRRGLKAEAAGLLTAEGAAGDLAVVLTLGSDKEAASIPRLATALARSEEISKGKIAASITHLLAVHNENQEAEVSVPPDVDKGLLGAIDRVRKSANDERYSADGFDALTTFLFDSSEYLRQLLSAPEDATQAMMLIEIVSTLSLAAAYRFTHRGGKRHRLRFGFASRLRERLTHTVPIPIAPRPRSDAVRVMTCHASKGLEFPCVIVAGQTLPTFPYAYASIPPSCRPRPHEDAEQANSLLFVGLTRAKRAVVISYPARATDSPGSRAKKVVPLLSEWMSASVTTHRKQWTAHGGPIADVTVNAIWGESIADSLKPAAVGDGICPTSTYLESMLELRFPEADASLYPVFFGALRKGLRALAKQALETGKPGTDSDADQCLENCFPEARWGKHPHFELYQQEARRNLRSFAAAFRPEAGLQLLDPEFDVTPSGDGIPVRLDFIARYVDASGVEAAIAYRPESFTDKLNKRGAINWSRITSAHPPFVLEWQANQHARGHIFSGADGTIYPLEWHSKQGMPQAVEGVVARHRALASDDFSTGIEPYICDRCRVRVTCPYWVGALS